MSRLLTLLSHTRRSGFNPTSVSGLKVWLDAQETSSLTLSGSDVTQWSDLSGNANHAANTGNYPAYNATGINSLPAVQFVGASSEFLTLTNLLTLTDFSIFFVAQGNTGHVLSHYESGAATEYSRIYDGQVTFDSSLNRDVQADIGAATGTQVTYISDQTANTITGRVNGSQTGQVGSTSAGVKLNQIGRVRGVGTGVPYYTGLIGSLLIYNRVVTDAERDKIEAYQKARFGI